MVDAIMADYIVHDITEKFGMCSRDLAAKATTGFGFEVRITE
jgi:hypothetical protein